MRLYKITLLPLLIFLLAVLCYGGNEKNLALKIDVSIQVDGELNELIWKEAPEANSLIQRQDDRIDSHLVKTSVKILYDGKYIYFGFNCFDSEPEKIVILSAERDGEIRNDDSVYVLLDTMQGSENYFYFVTNPFGVQADGKISTDGQHSDPSWNGNWVSNGQKTDSGWSAEIAISIDQMNLDFERDNKIRVGLSRVVPRLDSMFWQGPLDPAFKNDQLQNLNTLNFRAFNKGLQVSPHILLDSETHQESDIGGGLDLLYRFSEQTLGHFALYPDFKTVEPDMERINLSVYELYLPEKRMFFQEGLDIYDQKQRLFYSKRVSDIYGGIKFAGEIGSWEFAGISAMADKDTQIDEKTANFTTFNIKKNFSNSFSLGLTAANKLSGRKGRGAMGIETQFHFNDKFKIEGQLAYSYGDYRNDNVGFYIEPGYDSSTFHAHLRYSQMGKYFGDNVNHVGFIPDDNRRELDSSINKIFLFKKSGFNSLKYFSNYNIYWGIEGHLRSWQMDQGLSLRFKKNWQVSAFHTREYKLNEGYLPPKKIVIPSTITGYYTVWIWVEQLNQWIPDFIPIHSGGGYDYVPIKHIRNHRTRIESGYDSGTGNPFNIAVTFGKNFGSHFVMIDSSKKFSVGDKISFEYIFSNINYHSASKTIFKDTTIHIIKAFLRLTKNTSLKVFFQSNSLIKKMTMQSQLTYVFKFPFESIHLIYQKGIAPFGIKGTQDHALLLKIGNTF
jgi:hypothetical protein